MCQFASARMRVCCACAVAGGRVGGCVACVVACVGATQLVPKGNFSPAACCLQSRKPAQIACGRWLLLAVGRVRGGGRAGEHRCGPVWCSRCRTAHEWQTASLPYPVETVFHADRGTWDGSPARPPCTVFLQRVRSRHASVTVRPGTPALRTVGAAHGQVLEWGMCPPILRSRSPSSTSAQR